MRAVPMVPDQTGGKEIDFAGVGGMERERVVEEKGVTDGTVDYAI